MTDATPDRVAPACANCHVREGTIKWVGDGGSMALVHGVYTLWCERCVVAVQLAHAEERAALIPELRAKLEALDG